MSRMPNYINVGAVDAEGLGCVLHRGRGLQIGALVQYLATVVVTLLDF